MDELFFGVKRSKPRRSSPARRRRTPVRRTRRTPVRRTRRSPRRSPVRHRRHTTMCRKGLSLSKLRKLAIEHGVNIYSEAKTAVSKRTGLPKKPKMVSCATLEKRLKEAGLDNLYKRMPKVDVEMPEELFEETSSVEMPDVVPVPKKGIPPHVMMQADPACHSDFMALAQKQPNNRAKAKFLKEYKGYSMGSGPCDNRELVPVNMHGSEDDLDDYSEEAGFDMLYGRRHRGGARPKMTQKHVGEIVVKGRVHQVFRGKEGGLYYMKGKTGSKIYIDKKRLKKHSKNKFGTIEGCPDESAYKFNVRIDGLPGIWNNKKPGVYCVN